VASAFSGPRSFLAKASGENRAQADLSNCNICGHCISLCKCQAIVHSEMDMENFPAVNEEANFGNGGNSFNSSGTAKPPAL